MSNAAARSDRPPIQTAHLFPILDARLIELLRSLAPEEWNKPALPKWTVRDIAAHLLDSNVRRLSMERDRYFGESFSGSSYSDLVDFLNRLNDDWVQACRRLSPAVLTDLLEHTGRQLSEHVQSLDPFGPAAFGVAWAGEDISQSWFDVAREYTEKWHHQQQIREAVGRPGIMTRELYYPVLDTFMRALPMTYREVAAAEGTCIEVRVSGEAGGAWFLLRSGSKWSLGPGGDPPRAGVTIPGPIAWRLFTKGIDKEEALARLTITGDRQLGAHLVNTIAIMG